MSESAPSLFVYGTLQPGGPNAQVLERYGGTWRRATVRGRLRSEGWGADLGYPGLDLPAASPEPAGSGDVVRGQVLTTPALAGAWPELDAFEGDGYRRVRTTAILEGGAPLEVWVYALR
ncbi:MAG: gamma-glutamylcyclotransferase family protein [Acidobacteriota bacterium]